MSGDCLSVVVDDTGDPLGVPWFPVLKLAFLTKLGLASPGCICSIAGDVVPVCCGDVGMAPYVKGRLSCRA